MKGLKFISLHLSRKAERGSAPAEGINQGPHAGDRARDCKRLRDPWCLLEGWQSHSSERIRGEPMICT